MCFFKKKITLVLPHPEEKQNMSQTVSNTSIQSVLQLWFSKYLVPSNQQTYWSTAISIRVYDAYPLEILNLGVQPDTPGLSWEDNGIRHFTCLATWFNPGVVAHEQAHNSYSLLTPAQKAAFPIIYTPLKTSDPMIKYLYSINPYGLTNDIEGHAEIYRYLGEQMPSTLKIFYPRLF
jgi:hypothetical protein